MAFAQPFAQKVTVMNNDPTPLEPDPNAPESPGGVMGFWDHVEELRWVLIKSMGAMMLGCVLVLGFGVWFADALQWPLHQAYSLIGDPDREILLRTDGPMNVFTFILQLSFFGGIALSLPFIVYFTVGFVAPGLTDDEKNVLRPVCLSILLLFFLGSALGFFLLLPFYLYVSLSFEEAFGFASLWTPVKYYGLVVWTTLGLGLLFQSPLVIILLIYLDIVTVERLKAGRRYAIFIIMVIAALVTPGGDPLTLCVTALPLWALYEGSLIIGGRLRSRKPEPDEANEEWQ
ncbi:twin-arginine translocase subunit TatC [Cerasicoccus fimbriatus]|uniref:twin-arginine translocase subunit TatC n=1 Tax=Cerasicoccus fimbriatus TaxID=3014554 RepID=UPI0022B3E140|nr:twin-arginine translocase subunit TatC [Cerasicoccus sp. TK19100]